MLKQLNTFSSGLECLAVIDLVEIQIGIEKLLFRKVFIICRLEEIVLIKDGGAVFVDRSAQLSTF